MAFVENQGVKIYWDERGSGEPVLLIMGLSYPSYMWHRSRPVLATRYRTIALDNRGVGQSDVPAGPYTMAQMASDAVAVLDATGVERAYVIGVSMGGMIAQEFALQYPGRVRSLILACTAAGGPTAVQAEPAALQVLMSRANMTPDEAIEAIIPFIYHPATSRKLIDEDMAIRRKWYPETAGYMGQLQAIFGWEAYSRLEKIQAATLVIHGDADRLVPAANGKLIAGKIAGAKFAEIARASHIFDTDQPEASQRAILEFLDAQSHREQSAQA
jgi:3-oxoadipate enol-lactonase